MASQLSLFDHPAPPENPPASPFVSGSAGLARRDDPSSSHEAADRAARFAGTHEGLILDYLHTAPYPQTGAEIGNEIGLSNVQILRRMAALEARGLVARDEVRPCCVGRGRAVTWRLA